MNNIDVKFSEFKTNLEQLNWKYFEKDYPELAILIRIVADYHYREGLSMSEEALKEVQGKFQKLGEAVARGHAAIGGVVAALISTGVISAGLGTVIGVLVGLLASVIEPVKAINYSKERMDDLGNRLKKFSQSLHEFKPYNVADPLINLKREIFWKGLELLHSRPKCRSLTSGCAREHIWKTVQVDLFNKAYETILDIYIKLKPEQFQIDNKLEDIKQEKVVEIKPAKDIKKDSKIQIPLIFGVAILILLLKK